MTPILIVDQDALKEKKIYSIKKKYFLIAGIII